MTAIVVQGVLGWGNRKGGLEAYGPEGRWGGGEQGDLLGDHLESLGVTEGAELIVVVVPRKDQPHGDETARELLLNRIVRQVETAANEYLHGGVSEGAGEERIVRRPDGTVEPGKGWRWCPDCDGNGVVVEMSVGHPGLDDREYECTRCENGLVRAETKDENEVKGRGMADDQTTPLRDRVAETLAPFMADEDPDVRDWGPRFAADAVLAVLSPLVDLADWTLAYLEDDCRFDHHGYCQAHGLTEAPCPVGECRRFLDG